MKDKPRYILSGGGTGGHIFPAIAIADALRLINPDAEILFVGASGRMEMEKVPAAGYPIRGLWISGLQRKLSLSNMVFPLKVATSLFQARTILKEFKPDAVIGTGGYASGPLLRMAAIMGIPTLIHESNSFPGITNRLLAKKVDKVCVAFENMQRYFPTNKIIITGNPVRKDILYLNEKKSEAAAYFGLDDNRQTLLVVGGSLGARTLNESIMVSLNQIRDEHIQLIWQTGKSYSHLAELAIENLAYPGAKTSAFISRMDLAYALADVVVSRAGAIAISELCLCGKPSILVPSPNVTEDHQTKNAQALEVKDAAILLPDNRSREELGKTALALMNDEILKSKLSQNIRKLGFADAAGRIAIETNSLIKST